MKQTKFLEFQEVPTKPKRKTKLITVLNRRSGSSLGNIRWYSAWRQYTFEPRGLTVFNVGCLEDICGVIEDLMAERR